MASEARNKLDPSIDSNELCETAKNQQESSPREEQDKKESDLKDKRHCTQSAKGLQMDLDNAERNEIELEMLLRNKLNL